MDTKLRDLERAVSADGLQSEAGQRYITEMKRLGFKEVSEIVSNIDYLAGRDLSLEEFAQEIENKIKDKHRAKYFQFKLSFSGSCSGSYDYDPYDPYSSSHCDGDANVSIGIYGQRLETKREMKSRIKREEKLKQQERERQRAERNRRKEQRESRERSEREQYERLKRKFESEEKQERLLADIGEQAEASLRSYSPGYFKSWFNRKFKKLDNKTPLEVYDEGDINKLRMFALKAL